MKVLLIQHQNHARRLFRHLLSGLECTVVECPTLESATAEFKRGPFDLVFIEEPLPDQRPVEPIRRLRAHSATGDAFLVALIDRAAERDATSLIAAGADDFMVLPASLEDVQLRLGILVGMARKAGRHSSAAPASNGEQDRFFDNLPDGAFLLDQIGTLVAVNRRLADLTGYTTGQLVGQPAEYIGLPMAEEMPKLLAATEAAPDRLEHVTLVRRDMKPVPVVIRYAWLDPEAKTMVAGIARESGGTSAIVAPNGRHDTLDADAGALVFDRRGVVRSISPQLELLLATSADQMIGTSLRDLIHRQDLGRIPRVMAPTGSDALRPASASIRLRTGSGEWLPLYMTGRPAPEGAGDDGYSLVVSQIHSTELRGDPQQAPAGVDPLTGLPDRDTFIARLSTVMQDRGERSPVTVLFLNLDRFKMVNEQHGYAVGDALISSVARRIESLLSFADELARVGGDEFAILAGGIETHAGAVEFAERIVSDFSLRPFDTDGSDTFITPSIGIALSDSRSNSAAILLRQADGAAVQAKRSGRGKVRIYESRLERAETNRASLEHDLSQAIRRDELLVYYQPEVDLTTGAITGVEALVRWNHPSQGMIAPAKFIPTAEDAGLIDPIGLWVLERAAEQVSRWIGKFDLDEFGLSVNFSADQFKTENLITDLSAALRRASLPPSMLRVEITESVLIDDDADVVRRMSQLRKLGINLAIDDFGTGYASLSYLRALPISCLKVDRSFVSGAGATSGQLSITKSIASLARESGLGIVVEGIESAAQLGRVRKYGCTRGQGFYFSRPVTAETIEFLLMAGPYPFGNLIRAAAIDHQPQSSAAAS